MLTVAFVNSIIIITLWCVLFIVIIFYKTASQTINTLISFLCAIREHVGIGGTY